MLNDFSVRIPYGGKGGIGCAWARSSAVRRGHLHVSPALTTVGRLWPAFRRGPPPRTLSPPRHCPRVAPPCTPASTPAPHLPASLPKSRLSLGIFPAPWMAPSRSPAAKLSHLSLTLPPPCPLFHTSSFLSSTRHPLSRCARRVTPARVSLSPFSVKSLSNASTSSFMQQSSFGGRSLFRSSPQSWNRFGVCG